MKVRISSDFQEILPSVIENRLEEILCLRNYLFQKRYEEAKGIAHALKGVLGSYGFEEAYTMASQIDDDLKEMKYDEARGSADRLGHYMSRVEIEYIEEEF